MAATFEYNEDNGAATGSPAKGTTRNTAVTQVNWKSVDDVANVMTPVAKLTKQVLMTSSLPKNGGEVLFNRIGFVYQ